MRCMIYTLAVTCMELCFQGTTQAQQTQTLTGWACRQTKCRCISCRVLTLYFMGPCVSQAYQDAGHERSMSNTPHLQLLFPLALCKGLVAVFNCLGQEHPCTDWSGQEPCVLGGAVSIGGKWHLQCSSTAVSLLHAAQMP